ncbi:MAG: LytR C-terminal domain-containing protein [Pseudonocardiaceae bacterium]
MSLSNDSGRGRLRTTGLALLAVALLAVVIGLVVALHGERNSARTQPLTTPGHPPPTTLSPPLTPSVIPYPPPVPSNPAPAPETSPKTSESVPAQAATGAQLGDKGVSRGAVRVYNNSTISGLAARVARDLRAAGWTVVEVGNYARSTVPTTTAYYREGTDERASAEALRAEFGAQVEPRFAEIAGDGPGVILIVTNDYAR